MLAMWALHIHPAQVLLGKTYHHNCKYRWVCTSGGHVAEHTSSAEQQWLDIFLLIAIDAVEACLACVQAQ